MTPERWARVETILAQALEREPGIRGAFLREACGDDQALREEVESLLSFDSAAEHVVAGAVQQAAEMLELEASEVVQNGRIGVYRVIREIGRGGMGTVYLAERDDDQFHKKVAIKLVTRGMDTSALLERFRQERQILARLDHPYIARLLDGGSTPEGRPYLVMEYVEGQPITTWCVENHASVRQRLELLRKVCSAVQSAHQNLIVHRDLKPGNILVDSEGTPKLLDFGIAKLLASPDYPDLTIATGGMLMLTPDYASPEQVRREPITTATDVYALGAILYELLTGIRPHRLKDYTPMEIERAICNDEALRPSTAARRAAEPGHGPLIKPGDLDNIILMAMSKDPVRRYASAAELSEDLRRYLGDMPVQARQDTITYRTRKFLRRNKATLTAAFLVLVTLAGGITVSTIEGRRAQRRFADVRGMAHAVLFEIHDSIRDLPGSTKARELVVKTALQYLSGLSREAAGDPDIQLELAQAYERVGDVQGNAITGSLGHTEEALDSYRKAERLADELAQRRPGLAKAALIRMSARQNIGDIYARRGDNMAAALAIYQQAVDIGERLVESDPQNREAMQSLSSLYVAIAREDNDSTRSIAVARKALPVLERLASADPGNEELRQRLSDGYSMLGRGLLITNQLQGALEQFQRTVDVREELARAHPENYRYQRELMIAYSKVGDVLGPVAPTLDDPVRALASYKKMLAISENLAAADPANARAQFDYAMALTKTGDAYPLDAGSTEAETLLRKALAIFNTLAQADPSDLGITRNISSIYTFLARRQKHAGNTAEALRSYHEVIRIDEGLLANGSRNVPALRGLWRACNESARMLADRNQRAEALDLVNKAVAAAEAARTADPANAVTQAMLPEARANEAAVYEHLAGNTRQPATQRRSDWTRAVQAYRAAADGWQQIQPQQGWPKDRDAQLAAAREGSIRAAAALANLP